jgi:hypothetical protein
MPCSYGAHAVLRPCRFENDFSRPRHSTAWARHGMCELISAISRRPVGDLPRFGFFRLSRGHSRRLLPRMQLPFVMCLICSDDDGDSVLYEFLRINCYELILKAALILLLCYVPIMRSSFLCGQQLFQVFKFLNTHSKIFETFLPVIFQTSKVNVKFSFLFACSRHIMTSLFSFRGAAKGGEGCRAEPPQIPQNRNLKNRFCRYHDIDSFP